MIEMTYSPYNSAMYS